MIFLCIRLKNSSQSIQKKGICFHKVYIYWLILFFFVFKISDDGRPINIVIDDSGAMSSIIGVGSLVKLFFFFLDK